MKKIRIDITIRSGRKKFADIVLEKDGPDKEIDVLASALQTVFIKSDLALKMANKKIKSLNKR